MASTCFAGSHPQKSFGSILCDGMRSCNPKSRLVGVHSDEEQAS